MIDAIPEPLIAAGLWALCLRAKYRQDEGATGAWGFLAVGYTFSTVGRAILRAIFA